MTPDRPTRTYLAVPAHRNEMVAKAAVSEADAVFMDIEDAVPPPEKAAALAGAGAALQDLDWGRKHVCVRLNAIDSGSIDEEISALCRLSRLDAVILPKAEAVTDIAKVADCVRAAQGARERPVALELLIETARGVMNVDALAGSDPLLSALHLGVGDFAASIGARSAEIGASPDGYRHLSDGVEVPLDLFAYPMMRMLVAARAFGLRAIDGPCGAFSDDRATANSAMKAAAMGFDGKQVIHPRQIEPTRDAFTPSRSEVAYARKVAAAMEAAKASGLGAFTVDGRMIDEASIRQIKRILAFAE